MKSETVQWQVEDRKVRRSITHATQYGEWARLHANNWPTHQTALGHIKMLRARTELFEYRIVKVTTMREVIYSGEALDESETKTK